MDFSKLSIKKIRELIVFTALIVVALWKFDVVLGSETNYKSIKIQNLIYSDGKNSIAYNVTSNWGSTQKGVALKDAQPVITPILDSTGK